MKPKVVNVRNASVKLSKVIYVGRYTPLTLKGHPLANPFKLGRGASRAKRDECIAKYRKWLAVLPGRDELLRELADEVNRTGFPLACWCAPEACHADVLAEMIEAYGCIGMDGLLPDVWYEANGGKLKETTT